jgi:ketosteroid isomerase-like protein
MRKTILLAIAALLCTEGLCMASVMDDKKAVADLDTRYQAAVEANDAATMDAILADDFVLVLGNGTAQSKSDLIEEARSHKITWVHNVEEPGTQIVRVWGDTAVVTAKLWVKGQEGQRAFDRKLWFSDTYVRTPNGWRYVLGQASLALLSRPAIWPDRRRAIALRPPRMESSAFSPGLQQMVGDGDGRREAQAVHALATQHRAQLVLLDPERVGKLVVVDGERAILGFRKAPHHQG